MFGKFLKKNFQTCSNTNPCFAVNGKCRYYRDVKTKFFGYDAHGTPCLTKDYLYENYNVAGFSCKTCVPGQGCGVFPNMTFNAAWMNYLMNQGRNLAQQQGFAGYDIVGYNWSWNNCNCQFPDYYEYHNLQVWYGKCTIGVLP